MEIVRIRRRSDEEDDYERRIEEFESLTDLLEDDDEAEANDSEEE